VVFLFPFFSLKRSKKLSRDTGFGQKQALFYFLFVLAGSICMSFFNLFGYISAAISIILLFGSAVFIPVSVSLNQRPAIVETNMDFESFCAAYEISRREAEVIIEICNGKSNKAIADALFITLQTVKDHNHRIFTKTGVSSRVQLTNLVREKTQI
jgi:DNA-binding CsgD family transcriptional regulator